MIGHTVATDIGFATRLISAIVWQWAAIAIMRKTSKIQRSRSADAMVECGIDIPARFLTHPR